MKVITIQQPWASLIMIGAKTIETRSWATKYRGPILIHASAGLPKLNRELCAIEPFASHLKQLGSLPQGKIIGVADLVDVLSAESLLEEFSRFPGMWNVNERNFGDYSPGRYGWLLEQMHEFAEPIPAKGQLGIWNYEGTIPDTI